MILGSLGVYSPAAGVSLIHSEIKESEGKDPALRDFYNFFAKIT